jgi:3-carboxy-cis,cis-muconate cycloisomerase
MLMREQEVTARLDRAAVERLTDPAGYLGATDAFIDRVLAGA